MDAVRPYGEGRRGHLSCTLSVPDREGLDQPKRWCDTEHCCHTPGLGHAATCREGSLTGCVQPHDKGITVMRTARS